MCVCGFSLLLLAWTYGTFVRAGYSLSDLAIRSLDIVHATTGLPWWATIIAATVVVRSAVFPITLKSVRPYNIVRSTKVVVAEPNDPMDGVTTE